MFNEKELIWIIIVIVISTFIVIFPGNIEDPIIILAPTLIILLNVVVKKIAAPYFNLKIEYKVWEMQRYGFYNRSSWKKPFPMGLILPFFIYFMSLGWIKMLTFLQFDYENISRQRLLKNKGNMIHRRIEVNESDVAFTAAWGFYALIALSVIAAFLDIRSIAVYSIYYNLWNLIPFSNLDGSRLFFGSFISWVFIIILNALCLAFVIPFI